MLKVYEINGKQLLYEEGQQPAGAVEVREKATDPMETKTGKPENKARKAEMK